MFIESFQVVGAAVAQILILGAVGFILVKKNILGECGLDNLSRLTLDITLPIMIFTQLVRDFSFSIFPNWWIFPLISMAVTVLGLSVGFILSLFIKGEQHKMQFASLVGFQNSGYLPLPLLAALLPVGELKVMFIYLFLFLLGFNLIMFSVGIYLLTFLKGKKFDWFSLFSAPVLAVLLSFFLIFFKLNKFIPDLVYQPLKWLGDCTLPLAMLVVGGSLAKVELKHVDIKAMSLMCLAKLLILPAIGFLFVWKARMPFLVSLLIFIQLAMPPAANLSVIVRSYKKEDLLISQGTFFGHILSIITLPVLLSLYFAFIMLK
ncbi:MAG: AEC family transporter [Candidatus Omnitrophica bacterium]|nr:AEC family transporter [Candidatus Omnitrophota bacterium]